MSPREAGRKSNVLTETELELMTILWRLGEGTVHDVLEKLPQERELAYTSVSTILRILEQKGIVKSRKEGRGHSYVPVLSKESYEAATLTHVVDKVFDGAPSALVKRLLDETELSEEELKAIRKLVTERLS